MDAKERIWKDYQKVIADNNYYFQRSCIRQSFFPASEFAFFKIVSDVLNKNIFDDERHTTCTGIGYHCDVVPLETIMTVIARHFALMTDSGYKNMVISCVTSFGLYTEILHTWQSHPEILDKIRNYLWKATQREFKLPENISHASDIIYKFRSQIKANAKHKLFNQITGKPLKIVEHIGCHYAKMFPDKGIGGAEFPYVLQGMIDEWGGEVIDYPERRHCCGFGFRQYIVRANRGYCVSSSKKKFDSMKPYKPDLIVCNCPGCTMFMDKWQYLLAETYGITYDEDGCGIPVLTYEELAGLVLGYDPWDLGLQMHQVNSEPLLNKMGIHYNSEIKYALMNNRTNKKPEIPINLKCF